MCWHWILYSCSASVLNYDLHMATDTKLCAKKILIKSLVERTLCIDQIEASTSPPGIPRAFDTFVVPVGREFDNQSLHGGGEFWSPCTGGWDIWTKTSIWFRFGGFLFLFWVLLHATRFHFSLFIQQIVKQSTLWQGSCIILKQSECCGKKNLKKTKTGHFIYRLHKNLNGLYALDKSTSPHWEVALKNAGRHWT